MSLSHWDILVRTMENKLKKFIFIFLFLLAGCGDPCNCDNLSTDPFNLSTLPNGCGCSVGKIYVPDVGVDISKEITGTNTADVYAGHKLKN